MSGVDDQYVGTHFFRGQFLILSFESITGCRHDMMAKPLAGDELAELPAHDLAERKPPIVGSTCRLDSPTTTRLIASSVFSGKLTGISRCLAVAGNPACLSKPVVSRRPPTGSPELVDPSPPDGRRSLRKGERQQQRDAQQEATCGS